MLALSISVSPPGNCLHLKIAILSKARPLPGGSTHIITSYSGVKSWLSSPNLLIFCRAILAQEVLRDYLRPLLWLCRTLPFTSPQSYFFYSPRVLILRTRHHKLPTCISLAQSLYLKKSDLWQSQRTYKTCKDFQIRERPYSCRKVSNIQEKGLHQRRYAITKKKKKKMHKVFSH